MKFLKGKDACALLGMSAKTLQKHVNAGTIRREGERGSYRYGGGLIAAAQQAAAGIIPAELALKMLTSVVELVAYPAAKKTAEVAGVFGATSRELRRAQLLRNILTGTMEPDAKVRAMSDLLEGMQHADEAAEVYGVPYPGGDRHEIREIRGKRGLSGK